VLALEDRFCLDMDAVLPDVWLAQVVEQTCPYRGVHRGTPFGLMLVANDVKRHRDLSVESITSRYAEALSHQA
jgi:hypothetical protein